MKDNSYNQSCLEYEIPDDADSSVLKDRGS